MFNSLSDLIISHAKYRRHSIKSQSNAVMKLYNKLDKEISCFRKKTGLKCIRGCGACCESHKVEATALELLPLAMELCHKGKGEYWLCRAQKAELSGTCIFYDSKPSLKNQGHCSVYKYRPLLCRLFGFSAVVDKYNRPVLQTCAKIKMYCATEYKNAQERVKMGLRITRMVDFTNKLIEIDISNGVKQLPINQAISDSISRVLLRMNYLKSDKIRQKIY